MYLGFVVSNSTRRVGGGGGGGWGVESCWLVPLCYSCHSTASLAASTCFVKFSFIIFHVCLCK